MKNLLNIFEELSLLQYSLTLLAISVSTIMILTTITSTLL